MKGFWKTVLAVVVGLFLAGIVGFFIFTAFLGGIASALGGGGQVVLPREGVLKMDFSKMQVVESPTPSVRGLLSESQLAPVGLWNAVQGIKAAAADPGVKLIYLKADMAANDLAINEELRHALAEFRKSGKPVVAYTSMPQTGSYYLASVADKVYMPATAGSTIAMTGVGTQMFFFGDLLEKLGVNVQLIRHGKYKSAGETFVRNSPSQENLEMSQSMINSIWDTMASEISESRGISVSRLNEIIDNLELVDNEDMLRDSLVDELLTRDELRQKIATMAVKDDFKDVHMIPFADYVSAKVLPNLKAKQKIAVVYANGEIVEGEGSGNVAGDRFSTILSTLRNDESVKAVVLRVASPGGSVAASDEIKNEIDLLRKEKPVIASYGGYAASGGYWISNSCDRIFSDRQTLTGSIGVFSMIPDVSRTADKVLHVGIATVGSSKHSGMMSILRPLSADEKEYMTKSVEDIYEKFVNTVSEGRDLTPSYVDSIAQGRVWTGAQALDLKLVDEIGTLEDAVAFAAQAAGDVDLDNWDVVSVPTPMSDLEMIMAMLSKNIFHEEDVLADTPFQAIGAAFKDWDYNTSDRFYARLPYQYVFE